MNIHGLDDPSLLVIFDQLAVEDLLRAGWVCSRWNAIRAKSALSRHSLTLLVGKKARDRVKNSKLDNIPYGHLLTDDHEMPLVPIKECVDAQNEIVLTKISNFDAKFLARLFPNITNFTVSIQSNIKSINSLVCLLKLWSTDPKLTTLKLFTYDPRNKEQLWDKTERSLVSANRRLLSTINSITSLRVLTFDIDSVLFYVKGDLYAGDLKLDFSPILNRLERLHWHSCDFNYKSDELVDALAQFDNANDNLNEIGINSEQLLSKDFNNWISKISPQLALRFTQLSLQIDDDSISLFSPFCARFTNLTSLRLVINEDFFNINSTHLFPPIALLTRLTYLSILSHISILDCLRIQSEHFNFKRNRNSSVKILKLRVVVGQLEKDHSMVFDSLFLGNLFPNVQVFILELIPDDAFETIKSAVVTYDIKTLRSILFWCTNSFRKLTIIRTINPDREWPVEDVQLDDGDESDQVTDDNDQEEDEENANE